MCNQSLVVLKKINCIQKIILYIGAQKIIYIYIGRPIKLIRLFNKPKSDLFNLINF